MTAGTLYVSGMTDSDPATNQISPDPKVAATIVLSWIIVRSIGWGAHVE